MAEAFAGYDAGGISDTAAVETSSGTLAAPAVVIATGTFLDARMFIGEEMLEGGRRGESAWP